MSKTAEIVIECTPEQKAAYLKASGRQKLGAWVLEQLDRAAAESPAEKKNENLYKKHID